MLGGCMLPFWNETDVVVSKRYGTASAEAGGQRYFSLKEFENLQISDA
jgi:hypothetical protein